MCKGKGYFYHSSQRVKAGVTSATENPERFRAYGEYATGMVSISLLPEHLPAWGDRFTMINSVLLYRETRVRAAGAITTLKLPVVTRSLDLVQGATDINVLHAHKANVDGTTDVGLSLIPGQDFEVTAAGEIDWALGDASGNAPAEGVRFAISYYAHPRFVVIDHPHAFRDTFTKRKNPDEVFAPLPIMCNARLDFLGQDNE
jgi:hypothetical protein